MRSSRQRKQFVDVSVGVPAISGRHHRPEGRVDEPVGGPAELFIEVAKPDMPDATWAAIARSTPPEFATV
ncbi:MAG TPA: hypothetical protein VFC19_21535 [Candidatus Limnocylindrales bacterium]|nr:hypothetical protein [Candidatus Limnocylindrales bacterium]